jgi:peroxiredoxin/protein-disulfide isomerase
MTRVLQPGITAPGFVLLDEESGREVSLSEHTGRKVILVFFPASPDGPLVEQLGEYQAKMSALEEQGASLLGVSDASENELERLSANQGITFGLVSDSYPPGAISGNYGATSSDKQSVLPTVFVIDEEGMIRRVYESSKYSNLPNPAMVMRAIKKLAKVPKPPPVTQEDWQLGPPNAPVVVIEYADYQCGPCRETYRLLKQIASIYGDKILWIHRHLPLRHSHPLAQGAAEAAEAAGAQGKFWEMHDRLFEAEGALERQHLIGYAQDISLDLERFTDGLDNRRFKDAVNEDFKVAVRNKIKLPPALFINGLPLGGARTKEVICAQIDSLLACTSME